MVKQNFRSNNLAKIILKDGLDSRLILVFIPLLIVSIFGFSYAQMKAMSGSKITANTKSTELTSSHPTQTSNAIQVQPTSHAALDNNIERVDLPLINNSSPAPGVGPAPMNSAKSLQDAGGSDSGSSNKNDQLQAAGGSLKLDDLKL